MAITPDGKYLLTAANRVKPKATQPALVEALVKFDEHILELVRNADRIASLQLWDVKTGAVVKDFEVPGRIDSVQFIANGRDALVSADKELLSISDLWGSVEWRTACTHPPSISAFAVAEDINVAITGSADGTLKAWDLECWTELYTLTGATARVDYVTLGRDGRWAVSTSDDRSVKVWNLETGKVAMFAADFSLGTCAATEDGHTIVVGDDSGRLHFLKLEGVPSY